MGIMVDELRMMANNDALDIGTAWAALSDAADKIEELEKKLEDAQNAELRACWLVGEIRSAIGDSKGKLMQDELVVRCKELASSNPTADRRATAQEGAHE